MEEPELVLVLYMAGSASTRRPTTREGDRPEQGESGEGALGRAVLTQEAEEADRRPGKKDDEQPVV